MKRELKGGWPRRKNTRSPGYSRAPYEEGTERGFGMADDGRRAIIVLAIFAVVFADQVVEIASSPIVGASLAVGVLPCTEYRYPIHFWVL